MIAYIQVLQLLFLGAIIKIYDDMVDNNITSILKYKEYFKPFIYFLTKNALLGDFTLSFLVVLAFLSTPLQDIQDDNFWVVLGLFVGCIFIYNTFIAINSLFEQNCSIDFFVILAGIIYALSIFFEARIVKEEHSYRKLISRIIILFVAFILLYFIENQSIRKGIIIGSGYVIVSIIMQILLHNDYYLKSINEIMFLGQRV